MTYELILLTFFGGIAGGFALGYAVGVFVGMRVGRLGPPEEKL